MGIISGIIAIAIIALGYFLFVKAAEPIYNADEWSGRLWKWAEKNSISRRKLPRYEEDLEKLTELDISFRNLTCVPSELCNIISLTKLIADENRLSSLPKEISSLTNLTEVNFTGNLFADIPQELFKLEKLQCLFFGHNKLIAIPKEIGNLTDLKRLDLSNNHLTSLPDEITKLKLDSFFINGNPNLVLTNEQEKWVKNIKESDFNTSAKN
jgi:Leucine-rich repeat (LRR) protein